jgi:hypothetical protein
MRRSSARERIAVDEEIRSALGKGSGILVRLRGMPPR